MNEQQHTACLTLEDAQAWLDAALYALRGDGNGYRRRWVLETRNCVRAALSFRHALIRVNEDAADDNRRFGIPASHVDARVLCFCATVLRALEPTKKRRK